MTFHLMWTVNDCTLVPYTIIQDILSGAIFDSCVVVHMQLKHNINCTVLGGMYSMPVIQNENTES